MIKRELTKTNSGSKQAGRIESIKEWLGMNYSIKINIFDTSKSFIVSNNIEYAHAISENDIMLHMMDEGISCSKSLLKAIITNPNQMEAFNPITDYFDSLKGKWKGNSMIDFLCSYIKAHDFLDQDKDFYQNRMKYILKKWLVATVANVYGERGNDVAIGFLNAEGGIGKTTIIESLVPESLFEYYVISDKDERIFRMTDCFATKFIINFDEMVGITKSTAETFKKNMSLNMIDRKLPGESFSNRVQRIASCAFTSNKTQEMGGFLFTSDSGLLRRLATIEIDEIKDYRSKLDVDQLWAEAIALFFSSEFDYVFNRKDYEDLQAYNLRYVIETSAFKLIKEWYRIPESNEEPQFKMASDIVTDLKNAKKITSSMNIDDISIGQALKSLRYSRVGKKIPGKGSRYGYNVIPKF